MESSSPAISEPSNSSFTQRNPSTPHSPTMSSHLHSTTRRIFIGPTPTNWSYKKKSFFFSKSNYAKTRQINQDQQPTQQNRDSLILANGTVSKREKQKNFVAKRDSTGPTNLSSLDYNEIISKSQRY